MRSITLAILGVLIAASGSALADRDHRDHRDHRRPVVRDHRSHQRPVVQHGHRSFDRHDHGRTVTNHHHGTRRVIDRRPLHHHGGRFTFHNGHTVVYNRPVIQHRHYDHRHRPALIVESYPAQAGYIWVNGNWSWTGYEWTWNGGHYAPDPRISVYYDDGTYQ